ncbi:hypothetical protein ACQ9ZF_05095 [Cetobacterium somerae]|uniref:hypothetical protein n=1 Tax=Cetobacterium somerae TaxID=188913 RepID=UPI003D769F49
MKKRIKVFEAGNYPQGNYDLERVKKVFSGVDNPIGGIFSHTSKWAKEKKVPVSVGEFSNFEIKGSEVFADVEFNDKGANYYNDGILKGVSVEMDRTTDKLLKIAVLPVGINPGVSTAEFQEEEAGIVIEFEEVLQVGYKEILTALAALDVTVLSQIELETLSDAAYKLNDDKYRISKLTENGYTVVKTAEFSKEQLEEIAKNMNLQVVEFEQEVVLSPEELRTQIKSEIEFEAKLEQEIDGMKKIVPPSLQHVVEFAIRESAKKRDEIVEFSETEKVSEFEKITGDIKKLGVNKVFKNYFQDVAEFEEKNEVTNDKDRIDGYFK